ncbi:hypothetical protein [Frankia sp. CiP3]|uniref:hypothetical protein n=1 Tax=Frankia sp. CiP3 TaxID=2880971 RepID=UPI001EF4BB61|nr:hypothetical protein [Frankia sp. CiP3]
MSGGPNLAERGSRIGALGSALQSTDTRLTIVIDGIKGILTDGSWREFVTIRGEHVQHDRFQDFVTMPMLKGLGVTVDLIRRVLANDPEATTVLEETLRRGNRSGTRSDLLDRRSPAVSAPPAPRRDPKQGIRIGLLGQIRSLPDRNQDCRAPCFQHDAGGALTAGDRRVSERLPRLRRNGNTTENTARRRTQQDGQEVQR